MAFVRRANRAATVRMIAAVPAETGRVRPEKRATIVLPIAGHVVVMAPARLEKIVNRVRAIVDLVAATAHVMRVNRVAIARVIVRVAATVSVRAEKTATIASLIANPLAVMAFVNAARRVKAARMIAAERAAIQHAATGNAEPNAAKIRVRALVIAALDAAETCNARPGKIAIIVPRIVNHCVATGFANAVKAAIVPTTVTLKCVETDSAALVNRRAIVRKIVQVPAA